MAIIGSLFCGTAGDYQMGDIHAHFSTEGPGPSVFGDGCFAYTVDCLLTNPVIPILTLGYFHVFIHEMGHALMAKLHGYSIHNVRVNTSHCRGSGSGGGGEKLIAFAGPLAGILLESAKLVGAVALAHLVPSAIGVSLALFLGFGAVFWLFGELMYALSCQDDWRTITRCGHSYY